MIIKKSNKKNTFLIKISKSEWIAIGEKNGWWDLYHKDLDTIITIHSPKISSSEIKENLQLLKIPIDKIKIMPSFDEREGKLISFTIQAPIKYSKKITTFLTSIKALWTIK